MSKLIGIILLICMIVVMIIFIYYYLRYKAKKQRWQKQQRLYEQDWREKNISQNWLYNYFDNIYVIALPKRKPSMINLFEIIKVAPIFIKPVLKNTLNKTKCRETGIVAPDATHLLNTGRIACHLSHLKALKMGLANITTKSILVFEDDLMIPNPDKIETIMNNAIHNLPKDWDILLLGRCYDCCQKDKKISTFLSQVYCPYCRHAIAFSRKGAQYVVKHTIPMFHYGDNMIHKFISSGKLKAFAIVPSIFYQNKYNYTSALGNPNHSLPECSSGHVLEK